MRFTFPPINWGKKYLLWLPSYGLVVRKNESNVGKYFKVLKFSAEIKCNYLKSIRLYFENGLAYAY